MNLTKLPLFFALVTLNLTSACQFIHSEDVADPTARKIPIRCEAQRAPRPDPIDVNDPKREGGRYLNAFLTDSKYVPKGTDQESREVRNLYAHLTANVRFIPQAEFEDRLVALWREYEHQLNAEGVRDVVFLQTHIEEAVESGRRQERVSRSEHWVLRLVREHFAGTTPFDLSRVLPLTIGEGQKRQKELAGTEEHGDHFVGLQDLNNISQMRFVILDDVSVTGSIVSSHFYYLSMALADQRVQQRSAYIDIVIPYHMPYALSAHKKNASMHGFDPDKVRIIEPSLPSFFAIPTVGDIIVEGSAHWNTLTHLFPYEPSRYDDLEEYKGRLKERLLFGFAHMWPEPHAQVRDDSKRKGSVDLFEAILGYPAQKPYHNLFRADSTDSHR